MPRKVPSLSYLDVKNAKPQAKNHILTDGNGLFLEVLASGGKSWRFKYRFDGKERRMVFGLWPGISLEKARELREQTRTLVANGIDPNEKIKQDKAVKKFQAEYAENTFEKITRIWHTQKALRWSKGHGERILARIEQHLFPILGNRPIGDIRSSDVLPILEEIDGKGHGETAKRLRQYIESIFQYAVAHDWAERNVGFETRGILDRSEVTHRPAIIEPNKIGELLLAIEGYEGSPATLAALRLAPLVFVRPGNELIHAEWAEINWDTPDGPIWLIPAEKMKMRKEHIVPLSRQAIAILEDIHILTGGGRYVFPSERTLTRPMSNMTINSALRRLGYGKNEMCAHGFRTMASTRLNEMGYNRDWIEMQLAHVEKSTSRAPYNRAEYLPQRRKMMQRWANYLDKLKEEAGMRNRQVMAGVQQ